MRIGTVYCLSSLFFCAAVAIAAPPHLVVFISDDHSYLDTSFTGAEDLQTPNFDRVARQGMSFTRAFAVSPSCAPSRAALLTGLMPVDNGSMYNHQPPQASIKKLPAYLQELGYEVVAFGKVAHYNQGKQYGFDLVEHDSFHDDKCIAAAVEWLENRSSDRPLCLMVGTNWPHVPWPKSDPDVDPKQLDLPPTHVDTPRTRQARANYYAAVRRMDRDLGAVFDAAYDKLGDNTLFIHFADHGAQWPFGKWNLYDAGLQVPLLAVWPQYIAPGTNSNRLTTLVDILPTLIEAGGGAPNSALAGKSLLPTMKGASDEAPNEAFATHSGDGRMNKYPMRSVRTDRWKYIRNLDPATNYSTHIDKGNKGDGALYWQSWEKKAVTDANAARIVERYHQRPAEELYDLEADPCEQHNLVESAEARAALTKLRSDVDGWMKAHNDEGLPTERAMRPRPNRAEQAAAKPAASAT